MSYLLLSSLGCKEVERGTDVMNTLTRYFGPGWLEHAVFTNEVVNRKGTYWYKGLMVQVYNTRSFAKL